MNLNPEFQRNLWLEVSLHRLLGMPLVLGGIFFLIALSSQTEAGTHVAQAALGFFALFAFGWGTYLAGETVTSEVKHRTWDLQRMSSISPWSMTWGKLFGSTIYPWYGALICLLVHVLGGGTTGPATLAVLVIAAVLSQAVALLASLLAISKGQALERSAAVTNLLLGNLAAVPVWFMLTVSKTITWGGVAYDAQAFTLVSAVIWCLWAVVGCYRTMADELQVAQSPVAWVTFVLFTWLYLMGFQPPDRTPSDTVWHVRILFGYLLTLILTYLTLFNDRKEPAAFRRMLVARGQGQWRRLTVDMPTWMPTLLMAAVFGTILSVMLLTTDLPAMGDTDRKLAEAVAGLKGIAWLAANYLFVVRDVGIVLFFNLGARRTRADWTAMLYLSILYMLLPGIIMAMGFKDAVSVLIPWLPLHPLVSLASGAVQAGLVGALVVRRWRLGFGGRTPVTARPGDPA